MKINYSDENYKMYFVPLIIIIILVIIMLIGALYCLIFIKVSASVAFLMILLMTIPFLVMSIKKYTNSKKKRYLNLTIIKNGKLFKGTIESTYQKYFHGADFGSGFTENYATVGYKIDGEEKELIIDKIDHTVYKKIKKRENKEVTVYIYNNLYYVDLLNQ